MLKVELCPSLLSRDLDAPMNNLEAERVGQLCDPLCSFVQLVSLNFQRWSQLSSLSCHSFLSRRNSAPFSHRIVQILARTYFIPSWVCWHSTEDWPIAVLLAKARSCKENNILILPEKIASGVYRQYPHLISCFEHTHTPQCLSSYFAKNPFNVNALQKI